MRRHVEEDEGAHRFRCFDENGNHIRYVRAFSTQPGTLLVIRSDADGGILHPPPDSVLRYYEDEIQQTFYVVDIEAEPAMLVGISGFAHVEPRVARLCSIDGIPARHGGLRLDLAAMAGDVFAEVFTEGVAP